MNEFQRSFTFLTYWYTKLLDESLKNYTEKKTGNPNILYCMNLSMYHAWYDEMAELLVAKTQEYRVMRRSYNKKGESRLVNTLHHLNFLSINDLLESGTADSLQPYGNSSQWLFSLTGIEKQSAFRLEPCTMFWIFSLSLTRYEVQCSKDAVEQYWTKTVNQQHDHWSSSQFSSE